MNRMLIDWMERGRLPDGLIRVGIRSLLRQRLKQAKQAADDGTEQRFISSLSEQPIACDTDKANEQHYEVPAAFYETVLGPRLKYSSCLWPDQVTTLQQAEEEMLRLTCERADIQDGMDVLELGCGWGSLSIWMAEHYPEARIKAVSNSGSQKAFIDAAAARRGLTNLEVNTADMNDFQHDPGAFDRVVSVEMFEHMRNYPVLMERIAGWLYPDGKLFVHIFCHREHTYPFETQDATDWMGQYFFTGGLMPAESLLSHFHEHLQVEAQWAVNGVHYAETLLAWLRRMDEQRDVLMPLFEKTYGADDAARWFQRWRVFFMACEELFRFRHGSEWFVTHQLFRRR